MPTSMLSAESVLSVIRDFVLREKGEVAEPLDLDTPLLESGLVDSFGLVDLGADISRELGIPILSGTLLPEDFETPRILWNRIQEVTS